MSCHILEVDTMIGPDPIGLSFKRIGPGTTSSSTRPRNGGGTIISHRALKTRPLAVKIPDCIATDDEDWEPPT